MSDPRHDDLVADLKDLCDEIAGYTARWSEAAFVASQEHQRTLERTLELLGEIATRLGPAAPAADVDWRALRDLRVLLAHAYERVDARRLWHYATHEVRRLRASLE